jgi:hypothetical protein
MAEKPKKLGELKRRKDKSIPKEKKPKILGFQVKGMRFVEIDSMPEDDRDRARVLLKEYQVAVPGEIRCKPEEGAPDGAYTKEQCKEFDIPTMIFGIYQGNKVIGGLNIMRVQVIDDTVPGELTVSALMSPALPDPLKSKWARDTMDITEYFLDNKIPMDDGTLLNVIKWEMPEDAEQTFTDLHSAGFFDTWFEDNNLVVTSGTGSLQDGRKILFMGRA